MNLPNFDYEKKLWKKGLKYIGGIDEVGRGSFAGPVVAGCVVFDSIIYESIGKLPFKIDDSKKLTNRQRGIAAPWIKKHSLSWGIGKASVTLINKIGISKATQVAMRKAVNNANIKLKSENIEYLLLDAFYLPFMHGLPKGNVKINGVKHKKDGYYLISKAKSKQLAVINGDEKSVSIAAASIIAKVYRDALMKRIGDRKPYKKYDWINNKGYGSKRHRDTILRFGITRYHRKQFVQSFFNSTNN